MNDQQPGDVQQLQQKQCQEKHPIDSWWRSPFIGYPLAVVFAAAAFLIPWYEQLWNVQDYFIEPPFVIATIVVGWLWGTGPALLALLLEILAIDYWIIPPAGDFTFALGPDIASFGPFILIQLIILRLVAAQKRHRHQLSLAHQALSTFAEKLSESNQALTENNQALVQSNAQLDEANNMKDLFLSRASHELKTPITTIQGQVQIALRRLARQPSLPANMTFLLAHLEKIEAQTRRLNNLVNDLLSLSSLHSGKLPLQLAPCDLCSICSEIVEDQRALNNRCIRLTLPPAPVMLQADRGRLSQVITNLVVNAIKYSPADSIIEVEVLQKDEQAILTVHNSGPAIPPERLNNLFEPFYRAPEVQTSEIQGWGLGLAISKEIIEQHNGRIRVESSEEQGTTFFVELPYRPLCFS